MLNGYAKIACKLFYVWGSYYYVGHHHIFVNYIYTQHIMYKRVEERCVYLICEKLVTKSQVT